MKTVRVGARFISAKNSPRLLRIGIICVLIFLLTIQVWAANVSYVYDELNRLVQAIYDDGKIVTYTYDKVGNRRVKEIAQIQETISPPSKPVGPTDGTAEVSYSYSATGASSDLGHPIQYLFDWGDETNSGWLPVGETTASKFWVDSGTYDVRVRARCSNHDFILSAWSEALSVDIVPIQIDLQFPSDEAAFNCCSLERTKAGTLLKELTYFYSLNFADVKKRFKDSVLGASPGPTN